MQNTNYWTAIPHQLLVENEAMWPQGVHRYCRSYLVCEERENNFFLTLGAWILPRLASLTVIQSGIIYCRWLAAHMEYRIQVMILEEFLRFSFYEFEEY